MPWGLDFHIGLGDEELERTVDLEGEPATRDDAMHRLALANPPGLLADPQLGLAQAYVTRRLAGHERAEAMDASVRSVVAVPR